MEHYNITISNQIRVLAIAPYDGMAGLIEKEAKKFPELTLDVVTGNLEEGVQIAQANHPANYDLIISRGGTAELLREKVAIPVVEIPVSSFDILQAVQLSVHTPGKRAVVGFSNITHSARMINDLLNLGLDIYTLVESGDIQQVIHGLLQKDYATVICDVVASRFVHEAGLNAILITSTADSIDAALQKAVQTAHDMNFLRLENQILHSLLRERSSKTVVFDEHKDLYFSSLSPEDDHDILPILKVLIPEVHEGTAKHIWKSLKGSLYSIQASRFMVEEREYTAYFFTCSRASHGSRNAGITFYTCKEAAKIFQESFYHLAEKIKPLVHTIDAYNQTNLPVLITGEYGTGRTSVANYLYIHSPYRTKPLVEIDCKMLKNKSIYFLLHSQKSPLYFTGNTIHIKNMDGCSEQLMGDFLDLLTHIRVCANNHVIFSGDTKGVVFQSSIRSIKDQFQCCQMELSPLRDVREQIPAIASLYLNYLNTKLPHNVFRFDRKALDLLQEYAWPGNYVQFQRILTQAAMDTDDHMIHEKEIRKLLSMEESLEFSDIPPNMSFPLKRTLFEMERDIVRQVLHENNGNQTAAAKQLGIGRTTLWRMLKSE
ncbi:PrpR N-terminal domain-containing protein [Hominifimenecus sp. rT4P-3]|uniref:sigma-54-dependent transcriptional regulator n=1 Tax=Hominifimenecus sp. rT4P-3 TaxID=3242979 RepID=UPI003DA36E73